MMKKFKLFLLAFIAICAFVFLSNPQAKADDATVSTVDGASIRLTEPSGLRFIGQVTGNFTGTTVKYGFLLSKGDFTASQMQELYAHSYAKAVDAGELDGEGKFYVSIVNIPASGYDDDICALAYVDVDGVKTYATSSCTRNIEEVISAIDPTERNDFMNKIMNTSTFNLNGGEFVYSKSFKIGAFNGGTDGAHGIIIGNISSIKTAKYWYKIAIKQSSINSKIYEIVDTAVSGKQFTTEEPYDYCIAAYESNSADYALLSNVGGNRSNYIYIDSLSANGTVNVDTNAEKLLGNKIYYSSGSQLPSATKDYYTFNGWYDNVGLTGDPITSHSGDAPETYYAKFTPINYTLSYNLQGGSCNESTSDVIFTIESSTITLPAAGTMSRDGFDFVEWNTRSDGTGDSISNVLSGSHENITAYAIWAPLAPIEVELSSDDTRVLGLISPNKYVKSDFTAGRFSFNENIYNCGVELYPTISSAIEAASANDVIYVFAGNYNNETINVTTTGVKLYGPNYNITANSASPTRVSESSIGGSSIINVSGSGFVMNGLKLTGNAYVNISSSGTGMNYLYMYSNSAGMSVKGSGGNRLATVYAAASCTGLTVDNSYFNVGSSTYCRDAITLYGTASNITITNNYITNNASTPSTAEAIQFGTASGTINIRDNNIIYPTGNCVLYMAVGSASINIINNKICGKSSSLYTATVRLTAAKSGSTVNVIGNQFDYLNPNSFNLDKTESGALLNIKYNYFNGKTFQITNLGSGVINYVNNFYTETQTTVTSDAGAIASIEALVDAYTNSADYVTYGSVCVYSD